MSDAEQVRGKLREHLRFVRENSPYYGELWASAWPKGGAAPALVDLPPTAHAGYWAANGIDGNRLLTGPHENGIVFKSGGTTGDPKFSFFSEEDWRRFCRVFGGGMRRGGLKPGERVANVFYGGRLYASLLFVGRCIAESGAGVNFPVAGFAPVEEIVEVLREFHIDTVAGVPTTFMNMVPHLEAAAGTLNVSRFLYGGEGMYPDQMDALKEAVPGCSVQSIGIAGVDYGEMGWVDGSCEPGVHRVYDESTVLELLDESGAPLDAAGDEGELYITNFARRLMPVARYPVGDRGRWIDPPGVPGRRFKVLGRTEKGARIGPMTLYMEDVRRLIETAAGDADAIAFQVVVDHIDRRDRCRLRVAVPRPGEVPAATARAVIDTFYRERSMFAELLRDGLVHPLEVEWVAPDDLEANPRTGKLLRLIDRREA